MLVNTKQQSRQNPSHSIPLITPSPLCLLSCHTVRQPTPLDHCCTLQDQHVWLSNVGNRQTRIGYLSPLRASLVFEDARDLRHSAARLPHVHRKRRRVPRARASRRRVKPVSQLAHLPQKKSRPQADHTESADLISCSVGLG